MADKGLSSQSYGFPIYFPNVCMWELDYKESWVSKNWCFWTVVLEKTLQSPLDCKEIQLVIPKGNQSWIFIRRTDAKAETSILWPPDVKNQLVGKDPDAGKDWRQEEKGTTEDEMVEWLHDSMDISLSKLQELVMDREVWHAVVHPWGSKESDTTERLKWTDGFCTQYLPFGYLPMALWHYGVMPCLPALALCLSTHPSPPRVKPHSLPSILHMLFLLHFSLKVLSIWTGLHSGWKWV